MFSIKLSNYFYYKDPFFQVISKGVGKHTIILIMCLFFGNLVQECDHAECQIVQTIKSLNQQSLFNQVFSHHVER